jgi:hypothetical protein
LIATIDYVERTAANNLRHPMFAGLTNKIGLETRRSVRSAAKPSVGFAVQLLRISSSTVVLMLNAIYKCARRAPGFGKRCNHTRPVVCTLTILVEKPTKASDGLRPDVVSGGINGWHQWPYPIEVSHR